MTDINEQQLLNSRASKIGYRIENLDAAGRYRLHNKTDGSYFIVKKNSELRDLISSLEKEVSV